MSKDFIALVSQLMVGPGEVLRRELAHLRYVGPLRKVPERVFEVPRYPDDSRWSNGLAAWDTLHRAAAAGDSQLLSKVNVWLSSHERGYRGYSLFIRSMKELDIGSELYAGLISGRAFDDVDNVARELDRLPISNKLMLLDEQSLAEVQPADVGTGISQLLPVIVAILDRNRSLVAIEQPELHLHPAIQVTLGDLILECVDETDTGPAIIETHSEHLLLRILRRIRETTAGETSPGVRGIGLGEVSICFVEGGEHGARLRELRFNEDGEFLDTWPHGFFDERAEELFG